MNSLVLLGALVIVAIAFSCLSLFALRTMRELWSDNRRFQKDLMNAFIAKDWQQYSAMKLDLNPEPSIETPREALNTPVAYGASQDEMVQAALAAIGADLEGPLL